ncbi:MAG TPA: hypothetical protein VN718_03770 [Rhizomicrobium sp.]|nr:hypothetical protein [Rhizomicrobium sp.]
MRVLISAIFIFFFVAQAFAAEPAPAPSDKGGAPGTNVEMPFLMAPMTSGDGNLSGYAYISTRLTATSATGALDVRDKIAFIQDAFVRDVNGATVAKPADPGAVDSSALEARLLTDAKRVMGPGKVAAITIVQLQVAPLHPDSTQPPASMAAPGTPVPDDKPAKAAKATETAAK